jgi:hypothetical protein
VNHPRLRLRNVEIAESDQLPIPLQIPICCALNLLGIALLAKQVLSQLSYTPTVGVTFILKHFRAFQKSIPPFSGFTVRAKTIDGGRILAQRFCHFVRLAIEFR